MALNLRFASRWLHVLLLVSIASVAVALSVGSAAASAHSTASAHHRARCLARRHHHRRRHARCRGRIRYVARIAEGFSPDRRPPAANSGAGTTSTSSGSSATSGSTPIPGTAGTATSTVSGATSGLSGGNPATGTGTAGIANGFGKGMFGIAAGGALQNEDPATMSQDLASDQAAGSRWLRIDINWSLIQDGGSSSYNWTPIDNLVSGAEAHGMNVLGVILYTPGWARPSGTDASFGPDPAKYAAFARTAVQHYAAMGVHNYEVWNEPNTKAFWTPAPSPTAYANLLKAAYPAIKAADPQATVVTGGTAPAPTDGTNYGPVQWLQAIYAAGAKGNFDAVGHHPYCWPDYPGATDSWSAWYQMYGTSPSLRSVMVANGDGDKKIWATEFGAPTNGESGSYVDEATQAAMVTKAYQLFASYSWAGPLFFYQGRDQGTDTSTREDFFGFLRYDSSKKPSFFAYQQAAATL